jgi:hypothetical protein
MMKYVNRFYLMGLILALQSVVLYGQQKALPQGKASETTITVGPSKADIVGTDDKAIQGAIDMVSLRGGGTVKVLAGEYILNDAIHMRSNVNLMGEGIQKTILKHAPSVSSPLLKDADIGQKEATPKDASLFKVGMGIAIRSNRYQNDMATRPLTITKIENGVLYFNNYVEWDFTADFDGPEKVTGGGVVSNIYPLIWAFGIQNAKVDGLTVDSKVEDNPGWQNDVWTGGVCFERSQNCTISNVKSMNTRGDGILVITCEHVTVEKCEGAFNTHHGMHTGAHSPWTVIKNCVSHDNGSDGIYICWGVRFGEFTDNTIYHNGFGLIRNGLSIGHKDTDCLIARNHIYDNAKDGIRFRTKTEPNGPHRAKVIDNIIENNGVAGAKVRGAGIHICGIVHDVTIENNTIRETRKGDNRLQVNAVFIEKGVDRLKIANNKISGHPESAIVDNSKSPDNQLQAEK